MLWVYLCWRGGDTGNLSVVLSVLMINWLPSSFFPLLRLAWQKTPKPALTSNMLNNNKMCGVWSEWFKQQQSTRLCYPFSGIAGKLKRGRAIVLELLRTAYILEFKTIQRYSKQPNSKGHNEPRFNFITNGTMAVGKKMSLRDCSWH